MGWLADLWGAITPWTTYHEAQEAKQRYKGDWNALTPEQQEKYAYSYGDWFGSMTKHNEDLFYQSDEEAQKAKEDALKELMAPPASPFDNYVYSRLGAESFMYNPNATRRYSSFLD